MSAMSMFPGEMSIVNKAINHKEFLKLAEAIELKKMISFMQKVEVKIVKKRGKGAEYLQKFQ